MGAFVPRGTIAARLKICGSRALRADRLSTQAADTLFAQADSRRHSALQARFQSFALLEYLEYRGDGGVRLVVCDDGAGSDDPGGGFGLLGVRERVYLLGGSVDIRTTPGQGFALEVEVPG